MEVRETKKKFFIFLLSAYVNLGARTLYYTDSGILIFKQAVFSRELDLAVHWMTLTNASHLIVYMVVPPHHRVTQVQNILSSIFYTIYYIFHPNDLWLSSFNICQYMTSNVPKIVKDMGSHKLHTFVVPRNCSLRCT